MNRFVKSFVAAAAALAMGGSAAFITVWCFMHYPLLTLIALVFAVMWGWIHAVYFGREAGHPDAPHR